jgi:hypothetical protein
MSRKGIPNPRPKLVSNITPRSRVSYVPEPARVLALATCPVISSKMAPVIGPTHGETIRPVVAPMQNVPERPPTRLTTLSSFVISDENNCTSYSPSILRPRYAKSPAKPKCIQAFVIMAERAVPVVVATTPNNV